MATQKVVSIQDTAGDTYHLLAKTLRQGFNNVTNDVHSITKAQLRKVFAAKGWGIRAFVQYRYAGGKLYEESPIEYESFIDGDKRLNVGCKTFNYVTTRKIRRWVGPAKKAA